MPNTYPNHPGQPCIEITGIRIRRLLVPLRIPLATRIGLFDTAPYFAIDLHLRGGGQARLLAFTFARLGLTLVPPILEELTRLSAGRSFTMEDIPAFHDECQHHLSLLGHEGITQLALSTFDQLLYDALAREAGIPLYQLLGGSRKPVAAYNSSGPGLLEPDEASRVATKLVAAEGGYQHIKMRLGRDSIDDDIDAIHAVRQAIGPEVLISVDFNQCLYEPGALAACKAIDDLNLGWIEEPVIYDNYELQAHLTRNLSTPVQVGENWWSWRIGKQAIESKVSTFVMPDIQRIGGVTGWMRLASVAEAHSVPFSSHQAPDYSVHVMTATPTAHWLEYMDWAQDMLKDPMVPEAGFALPREAPGAGMEWNETALAKCVIEESNMVNI